MTDYKNLKLIASSSPHIRSNENTRSIMLDVIIAMLPALVWAIYNFGFKALISVAVSVVACLFWEWLYRKLLKKPQAIGDLSAVVTGMLLAFVCPPELPWWALIIGAFFSIVVVKQLYGGIGCNFLNPALAGRAILLASYATAMTTWSLPSSKKALADVISTATPLQIMKEGTAEKFTELTTNYTVGDMFIGRIGGSLGEVSALLLIVGGLYLIMRRVISPRIPAAFLGTVAVLTFLFPRDGTSLEWMTAQLCSGGLVLGAFFMATDYTTSPVTPRGQVLYGVGCGLLTVLLRYYGSYPDGVGWAILTMNCLVWLMDRAGMPRRFGVERFTAVREGLRAAGESLRSNLSIRAAPPPCPGEPCPASAIWTSSGPRPRPPASCWRW